MRIKIILLSFVFFTLVSCNSDTKNISNVVSKNEETVEKIEKVGGNVIEEEVRKLGYIDSDLQTDTSKTSIDFRKVLAGGPAKDGIPAINEPNFLSIEEARGQMEYLGEKDYGIAVEVGGESRYYPYAVLVWHEIVNDEINGEKIAVTFCPLCGSAVVYDRVLESGEVNFGVSGKLYESNMLMYDSETESLWSQNLGEALIGERLGEKLELVQSNLMTFGEYQNKFPNGKILSDNTGHQRNYGEIPYGDYDTSDELIFPVENQDSSFAKKEVFYIVRVGESSIAFHLADLRSQNVAKYTVGESEYTATFDEGLITVESDGNIIPGYYEMWFSWRTHNLQNSNIWNIQ